MTMDDLPLELDDSISEDYYKQLYQEWTNLFKELGLIEDE